MQLHLFGARTPTGEAFKRQLCSSQQGFELFAYSRHDPSLLPVNFSYPHSFHSGGNPFAPSIWISFAPIWLLSPFLEELALRHPERLQNLRGVVACSSSSVITKRFATNQFDRELVARLNFAENQIIATCENLDLPCLILRPTLIYGRVGPYLDRNISRLIFLMRRLPLLPVPSHTGLRQPIHASQLSSVVLKLILQFHATGWKTLGPQRISLGGDTELGYSSMLLALQQSLHDSDLARRCSLLPIPTRLFYAFASPLLLHSPKAFEAVLRMGSDLSGFTPAHQLLNVDPQPFPLHPLI